MLPDQATTWYRRMSALYAIGAWSLVGLLFFYYGQKKSKPLEPGLEDITSHLLCQSLTSLPPIQRLSCTRRRASVQLLSDPCPVDY